MKRLLLIYSSLLCGKIQLSFEFSQNAFVRPTHRTRCCGTNCKASSFHTTAPSSVSSSSSTNNASSGQQRETKDDDTSGLRLDSTGSAWPQQQPQPVLAEVGGVYYGTSVLPLSDFDRLLEQVRRLLSTTRLCEECATSVATNRQGLALPDHSPLIPLLDRSLSRWIPRQLRKQRKVRRHPDAGPSPDGTLSPASKGSHDSSAHYVLSPDVPVELRVYQRPGAGMAWHVDDVLYDPPQLEVVVTLENTSDCVTLWKPSASTSSASKDSAAVSAVRAVETDLNSALLLVAGGAPHCVTTLTRGKRTIVKLVYIQPGAIYLGATAAYRTHGSGGRAASDSQFASLPRQSKKEMKKSFQQGKPGRK